MIVINQNQRFSDKQIIKKRGALYAPLKWANGCKPAFSFP